MTEPNSVMIVAELPTTCNYLTGVLVDGVFTHSSGSVKGSLAHEPDESMDSIQTRLRATVGLPVDAPVLLL